MLPEQIFQFHRASDLAPGLDELPNRPGVYVVLLRGGDRILESTRYFVYHDRLPYQREDFWHLYTGCGAEWGRRIRHHLTGNTVNSNLRFTLAALEHQARAIYRSGIGPWDSPLAPERLTSWLLQNTLVGVVECADPFTLEKAILEAEPSPLNIDQRRWDGFAQYLLEIRARARSHIERTS
jgi:hypothetical protein